MQRTAALVCVAVAMLALVACSSPSTTTPSGGGTGTGTSGGGATVTLSNIAFNPSSLTVQVGDTVTFKNADNVPHEIVVGTQNLGQQAPGEEKTWKATADGVFPMKCVIHPSMQGQITVGSGGGGASTSTPATGSGGTGGSSVGTAPGY